MLQTQKKPHTSMVLTRCTPVSSRCRCSSIAASTSMLFLRRLPPNEAWFLIFRYGVLTAFFIRVSVTEVEMIRMRSSCPPSASSSAASPCKTRSEMMSMAESDTVRPVATKRASCVQLCGRPDPSTAKSSCACVKMSCL